MRELYLALHGLTPADMDKVHARNTAARIRRLAKRQGIRASKFRTDGLWYFGLGGPGGLVGRTEAEALAWLES